MFFRKTPHVTCAITNCKESDNLRVLAIQSYQIYFFIWLSYKNRTLVINTAIYKQHDFDYLLTHLNIPSSSVKFAHILMVLTVF